MISKVFDLFVQVDRSLDRSQGGLGIGLTLVRRLMELHGGSVRVRSEGPGRGSEFICLEPTAHGASPSSRRESHPCRVNRAIRVLPKILVVDDNVDSARSLSRLLRLSGHEVSTVHDGLGALERFEEFDRSSCFLEHWTSRDGRL